MNTETVILILKLLDLLATAALRTPVVKAKFDALRGELSDMVTEGREPSLAEWERLNARADALHAELQGRS